MRWAGRRQSDNIEDRRGSRATRVGFGGGIGVLALVLLYTIFGGDPRQLLDSLPQGQGGEASLEDAPSVGGGEVAYQGSPEEERLREFIGVVLAETEGTWGALFREAGRAYQEPTLVLFSGAVDSACGFAESAVGPFYCPANRKVYIDLSFYQDLQDRFGAPGDFAQAYVIAHEVGHHVQNLLGISDQVREAQSRGGRAEANALSVRLELQADCLAGIWAHHAERSRDLLEEGDVEEGMRAAAAIGDDRMQRQSRGYVSPESFTHGSSQQRVRWFRIGLEQGSFDACDTFAARAL